MEAKVMMRLSRTVKKSSSKDGGVGYDHTVDVQISDGATDDECKMVRDLCMKYYKELQKSENN